MVEWPRRNIRVVVCVNDDWEHSDAQTVCLEMSDNLRLLEAPGASDECHRHAQTECPHLFNTCGAFVPSGRCAAARWMMNVAGIASSMVWPTMGTTILPRCRKQQNDEDSADDEESVRWSFLTLDGLIRRR